MVVRRNHHTGLLRRKMEINVVIQERRVNPPRRSHQCHQQVSSVTPVVNVAPIIIASQRPAPQGSQGKNKRREPFDSIPMSYAELLPALIQKKLVQTRPPPAIPSLYLGTTRQIRRALSIRVYQGIM